MRLGCRVADVVLPEVSTVDLIIYNLEWFKNLTIVPTGILPFAEDIVILELPEVPVANTLLLVFVRFFLAPKFCGTIICIGAQFPLSTNKLNSSLALSLNGSKLVVSSHRCAALLAVSRLKERASAANTGTLLFQLIGTVNLAITFDPS
jgi:hypothetical protein